jgi:hypothetical protein
MTVTEKLTGRKAKPSNHMRFEANHGKLIHRCHIPEFPFRNVNRFLKEIQIFPTDFNYFHLK